MYGPLKYMKRGVMVESGAYKKLITRLYVEFPTEVPRRDN